MYGYYKWIGDTTVSNHYDCKCLLPTSMIPCGRIQLEVGTDPQGHLWAAHYFKHTGLGAGLWLAQFLAFSLNLMC